MIISASRRTDIPAFYSQWFIKRLQAGYVDVQNPMNPQQISRIPLHKDTADCFLLATKNPLPMLRLVGGKCALDTVKDFGVPAIFHFTLTPYGRDIESSLPSKDRLIEAFIELAHRLGKDCMVWRYDPVVFAHGWNVEKHKEAFSAYAQRLAGSTRRCIVSFFMVYKKFSSDMVRSLGGVIPLADRLDLAQHFFHECQKYGMRLSICCDAHDYSDVGITTCGCIDREVIETVIGCPIEIPKEKELRDNCLCLPSVDIGAYDTCGNGCQYCYAVSNHTMVRRRMNLHDRHSSMLIGHVPSSVVPKVRVMKSLKIKQVQLGLL